ncbi:Origin recognition complex subunit 5 C-terminal domain-containing protein [Plasmodiophora brassicae]
MATGFDWASQLHELLHDALSPTLVFVTGQWTDDMFADVVVVPGRGMSADEVLAVVCKRIGVRDLLAPVSLPSAVTVVCTHIAPGDKDLEKLVQAPAAVHGLRLVIATRFPIHVRTDVFSRTLDIVLSADDLVQILAERCQASDELVRYMIKASDMQDIDELAHHVGLMRPVYEREVSKANGNVTHALLNLKSYLKPLLFDAGTHTVSAADVAGYTPQKHIESTTYPPDLSRLSKFILVASFLASYNPIGTDDRIFRHERKQRRRRDREETVVKMPQILCGPREFSLDRMLGILARLRTDKSDVAINENVYTQIADLVAIKYLKIITFSANSGRTILDTTKLVCHIDRDTVECLAKDVGVPFAAYLHAPVS